MKTQTRQKNKALAIAILLAATIILSVSSSPTSAQIAPMQKGVNYLSNGNAWTEPETLLQNDFSRFQQDHIRYLSIRIMWSIMMPTPGNISTVALENIKKMLNTADAYGLKVNLAFWTQFGYTMGFPSWAGTNYYSLLEEPTKTYYLNYLTQTVEQLKTFPAVDSWSILNEPYYTDPNQKNQFQTLMADCVQTIKTVDDSRPVICRFTLSYTPATGKYDSTIYNLFDAFAVTVYLNASNPSDKIYNSQWVDYAKTVEDCKNLGLPLWVIEFGSKTPDPEAAQAMFEGNLAKFGADGIARAYAWAWQTRNAASELFNIYDGANPKPAYYALVHTEASNPTNPASLNADSAITAQSNTQKAVITPSTPEPEPKKTVTGTISDNTSIPKPSSVALQTRPAAAAFALTTDYQELNVVCLGIALICVIIQFRSKKRGLDLEKYGFFKKEAKQE
jgi:hypothetical protein